MRLLAALFLSLFLLAPVATAKPARRSTPAAKPAKPQPRTQAKRHVPPKRLNCAHTFPGGAHCFKKAAPGSLYCAEHRRKH